MGDISLTVVTDYDREHVAVFVGSEYVFGSDPYEVNVAELLRMLIERDMLVGYKVVEDGTYNDPSEYFD